MATCEAAKEELRIAKIVLQIARENHYLKVIPYLEENVIKAQKKVNAFGEFSPSKILFDFFGVSEQKDELPFRADRASTPCREVIVVDDCV
jgi:predicted P-loop ATPase